MAKTLILTDNGFRIKFIKRVGKFMIYKGNEQASKEKFDCEFCARDYAEQKL